MCATGDTRSKPAASATRRAPERATARASRLEPRDRIRPPSVRRRSRIGRPGLLCGGGPAVLTIVDQVVDDAGFRQRGSVAEILERVLGDLRSEEHTSELQ